MDSFLTTGEPDESMVTSPPPHIRNINNINNNNENNNSENNNNNNFFIEDVPENQNRTQSWPPQKDPNEHPLNKYVLGVELGRGSCGVVRKVLEKSTHTYYALKSVPKKFVSRHSWLNLTREVEIMLSVDHPNVIKLKEIIDTKTQLHIVLQYMDGGELFGKIVKKGFFNERDASNIVKQIISGVGYLHDLGIAHRDLKPENLLCDANITRVVVADFGLAKIFGRGELLQTACGTQAYAAPEVLRGTIYDKSCDMWSTGVITYILLCGHFPFHSDSDEELRKNILSGNFYFPDSQWGHISEMAKDFIRTLLVIDQSKRATAKQALMHPWLNSEETGFTKSRLDLSGSLDNWNFTSSKTKNVVTNEDVMEVEY